MAPDDFEKTVYVNATESTKTLPAGSEPDPTTIWGNFSRRLNSILAIPND
ncbi:hypothetical protein V1527DRAFT_451769 [Lipomyces starkeyi]